MLAWNSSRVTNKEVYIVALRYLFSLSGSPLIRIEADVVQRLSLINWALAIKWYKGWVLPMDWVEAFFDKVHGLKQFWLDLLTNKIYLTDTRKPASQDHPFIPSQLSSQGDLCDEAR